MPSKFWELLVVVVVVERRPPPPPPIVVEEEDSEEEGGESRCFKTTSVLSSMSLSLSMLAGDSGGAV